LKRDGGGAVRLKYLCFLVVLLFTLMTILTVSAQYKETVAQAIVLPSGYQLPFPVGETWHYNRGPHGHNGVAGEPWSAIDIAPPEVVGCSADINDSTTLTNRWVVASQSGIVEYAEGHGVIINHQGGWRTYYYHLNNLVVSKDQTVTQNQHLGNPSCKGHTTGIHLHFAVSHNNLHVPIAGSTLSGWTILNTNPPRHYEGLATDGTRTVTASIYRSGTAIQNNRASSNATSWNFAEHGLLGWSPTRMDAFAHDVIPGHEHGVSFTINEPDPSFTSPVLTSVSTNNFTHLHVRMQTLVESCAEIFIRNSGMSHFAEPSLFFITNTNGVMYDYFISLRENSYYNGRIEQIRLDPACNQPNGQRVRINYIGFVHERTIDGPSLSWGTWVNGPASLNAITVARHAYTILPENVSTPYTLTIERTGGNSGLEALVSDVAGNSIRWGESSDGSLTLNVPAGAGSFYLTVGSDGEPHSQVSYRVKATLNTPPITNTIITTQPQNVTVMEPEPATFNVSATGDNLTFQWEQLINANWMNVSGATDPTLTFNSTGIVMNGLQVRVVVTGDGGVVISEAVTLTVNPEFPAVTPDPEPPSIACRVIAAVDDSHTTVDISHIQAFAGRFGAVAGNGHYQAEFDLNNDGAIGIADVQQAASVFGQSCS
jgi:hypothetical protein